MVKQHIIELNGKRYDTVTGKMIVPESPHQLPSKPKTSLHQSKNMDGFSRASSTATLHTNPMQNHKTSKSTTLMRTSVPKPSPAKMPTPSKLNPAIKHNIATFASPDKTKLAHAKSVPKSALVRRFFNDTTAPNKQSHSASTDNTQVLSRIVATAHSVESNHTSAALANADSHNQPKIKRDRQHVRLARRLKISPRMVSASTFILAGLLIGGFFAYQNVSNLNMRLASARAGVPGSLPAYQPAGFSLNGGISYKPGEITVGYKSNGDERNFKLTQANSAWNSETLLDNYLVTNKKDYQVVADNGKTIYLYDGSNATWVDGGIWYKVEGNSQLNSDQLLSLANSL